MGPLQVLQLRHVSDSLVMAFALRAGVARSPARNRSRRGLLLTPAPATRAADRDIAG
jgi:hypothetical protein